MFPLNSSVCNSVDETVDAFKQVILEYPNDFFCVFYKNNDLPEKLVEAFGTRVRMMTSNTFEVRDGEHAATLQLFHADVKTFRSNPKWNHVLIAEIEQIDPGVVFEIVIPHHYHYTLTSCLMTGATVPEWYHKMKFV